MAVEGAYSGGSVTGLFGGPAAVGLDEECFQFEEGFVAMGYLILSKRLSIDGHRVRKTGRGELCTLASLSISAYV